jgi:PDZ domain-containing protein
VAVAAVVLGVAYLLAQNYTSKLYALAPGGTLPVQGAITVKAPATQVHNHLGRILLVTVSLRSVQPFTYVFDQLDPNVQVVNQRDLIGNSKPSQQGQVDAVQMDTSTQTAAVVALQRLGYKVTIQDVGTLVADVQAHSPADGHLVPGDTITAIDGTPTPSNDVLEKVIRSHQPGQTVTLAVRPATGADRTESVRLGQSPPSLGAPHAFLGISTDTKQEAKLPFNVTIDPGNIGGPSAGLAFTLGVLDKLSTGDLTGGRVIAATGTINPDGSVGPIGGIVQKTAAVRKAGAVAFLVPSDEYAQAVQHAGSHLRVIKVNNLGDALNALRSLGGDFSGLAPAAPPAAA